MGFFSSLKGSFNKSKMLRNLQMEITSGANRKNQAIDEFLDLCESDEGVAKVMIQYNLNRNDLKDIYKRLVGSGLGQWIKGHYAALSTIAYFEPLIYVVDSEKKGTKWEEIVGNILYYWQGKIPQGRLYKKIN
jgi:predicted transcriptional regulator